MSFLAPLFLAGLVAGDRPSLAQLAGAVVAAVGVLLVASEPARRGETVGAPALPGGPAVEPEVVGREGDGHDQDATSVERRRVQRQAIGLSFLAAACIGVALLGYDAAAQHDPIWAVLAGRASSATLFALILLVTRPRIVATAAAVPGIVTVGLADTGANGMFAVATTHGYLSIVAVLSSVYPAVTVMLAYAFLRERIAPHQLAGVVATLGGVSLIAAG
jgi:drug/metabolite transporter (DMT)-like permease